MDLKGTSAMILTRSADYALRATMYLATRPQGTVVPLDEIAQSQRVPAALLSKILQTLVKGGLLRSRKGYGGGFALQVSPAEISLDAVIELVDGPFTVFECLVDEDFCTLCTTCKLRTKFLELQDTMRDMLKATTIEEVLPEPNCALAGGEARVKDEAKL